MNSLKRTFVMTSVCVALSAGMARPAMAMGAFQAPTIQEVNAAVNNEDFEGAEELCRAILEEDSKNSQAWFFLGYSLHIQGELDEAIFAHIAATGFPETAALAYYNLGCAQALKGNADQAFPALFKSRDLGVTNIAQYLGDSDLTSLKTDKRWTKLIDSMRPNQGGASANASASASASASSPASDASSASDAARESSSKSMGAMADGLHFWIGSWDCYSVKSGELMGQNTLSFRVNKHVIHEQWTSEDDSYAGESWNFFDPISKAWSQTWLNDKGYATQYIADTKSNAYGVMFAGKSLNPDSGAFYKLHRMHVRPVMDGYVRQTGSESTDDGTTWTVKYDLIYVPKGEAFDVEDLGI